MISCALLASMPAVAQMAPDRSGRMTVVVYGEVDLNLETPDLGAPKLEK